MGKNGRCGLNSFQRSLASFVYEVRKQNINIFSVSWMGKLKLREFKDLSLFLQILETRCEEIKRCPSSKEPAVSSGKILSRVHRRRMLWVLN